MKKILLFAIGVLTSVTMMAEVKPYTDSDTGLKYRYDTETGFATLIDGKGITATKVDFILSSFEVDGIWYDVTSIGDEAFTTKEDNKYIGNTSIEYVVIPEGVKTIGKNAFNNCIILVFLSKSFFTNSCYSILYVITFY